LNECWIRERKWCGVLRIEKMGVQWYWKNNIGDGLRPAAMGVLNLILNKQNMHNGLLKGVEGCVGGERWWTN